MLSLFIEYVISIYFPKISTIIFFHPPLIQEKILTLLSCKYCYANAEPSIVMKQSRLHDPKSPFLIGNYEKNDSIHDVPQQSWADGQMSLKL